MSLELALYTIQEASEERAGRLDLSGLDLETVPEEIVTLAEHLTHLSLRRNQLTELPDVIRRLPQLEQLSAADNQISTIPAFISQFDRLHTLNLKNNRITRLPDHLLDYDRLSNLQLAGNPIDALPADIISKYNQPHEILGYYKTYIWKPPLPPPLTLRELVLKYFNELELANLWETLTVPDEIRHGADYATQADMLVTYHVSNGLEAEFRDLMQVLVPHISWENAPLAPAESTESDG